MLAVFTKLALAAALVAPSLAATNYASGADYPFVVNDPGKSGKQPAIIFLHGSGSCGSDLSSNPYWDGVGMLVHSSSDAGSVVKSDMISILPLHPDCSSDVRDWDPAKVKSVIDLAKSKYEIDDDEFYCSGYSMGGKGTWLLAMAYPTLCKKMIVSAGYTEFSSSLSVLTASLLSPLIGIPMRLFAGSNDDKQPASSTAEPVYNLLKGLDATDVTLEVIQGADHSAMSSKPWLEDSLWSWVTDSSSAADDDSSSSSSASSSYSHSATSTKASSHSATSTKSYYSSGTHTSSSAYSTHTVVKNLKCSANSTSTRRRKRAAIALQDTKLPITKRMHLVPRRPGTPRHPGAPKRY